MKRLADLQELKSTASYDDVVKALEVSKKVLAKRLAKLLGKKDAKLFDEDENEKYILEVALTDLEGLIAKHNLIIKYANLGRNIANLGINAINQLVGLVLPFVFKKVAELKAEGLSDEDALQLASNQFDIDLNEEEENNA